MKLDPVDVAELEQSLDAQVSANDRESVSVGADLSQRDAQLSQGGGVDVIDRAKIDRDPAMAGAQRRSLRLRNAKTVPASARSGSAITAASPRAW